MIFSCWVYTVALYTPCSCYQIKRRELQTNEKYLNFYWTWMRFCIFMLTLLLCVGPFSHTKRRKKIRLNCNKNFACWAKTIRAATDSDWFFIRIRYHTFPLCVRFFSRRFVPLLDYISIHVLFLHPCSVQ